MKYITRICEVDKGKKNLSYKVTCTYLVNMQALTIQAAYG